MLARLALVLLVACGGKSSPAGQPKTAYEELEARLPKLLSAMDQLAKDVSAIADDCPKIAAVLRKWGSEWAVELDAIGDLKTKLSANERERFEHDHDEDSERIEPVLKASAQNCKDDKEVGDALGVAGFRRASP